MAQLEDRTVPATIALWNFNSPVPDGNSATGTTSPVFGTGALAPVGGTTTSFNSGSINNASSDPNQNDDTGLNVVGFPAQGQATGPVGLGITVDTRGYQSVQFTFDQRNSNTASGLEAVQYSLDGGATWATAATLSMTNGESWVKGRTVDLSGVAGAADNPNLGLRIVSQAGSSGFVATEPGSNYGTRGTWRFDMMEVSAELIPVQATVTGWGGWEQAPMGQPRGETNAATPDWTANGDIRRTPAPAGAGNLGEEGGYYRTKNEWGAFEMSVQFRFPENTPRVTPGKPGAVKPQSNHDFGNSGIYIYDRWEVQIIDPTRFDGAGGPVAEGGNISDDPRDTNGNKAYLTPGSLYGVPTPSGKYENWVKAGDWNTLTIQFTPPVLEPNPASGANPKLPKERIKTAAHLVTKLNGHVVFDGDIQQAGTPLSGTGSRGNTTDDKKTIFPPLASGRVYLQSHWGAQVEFQNPTITGTQTA